MALRLFRCPACGAEELRERTYELVTDRPPLYKDEDRPVPVLCSASNCTFEMSQVLIGQGHDLLHEDFIIGDVDGKGERRISSLSELRQIERESEQRHRNGEGQILNFRDFTQDAGNKRTNAFTNSSYETGRSKKADTRRTQSNLPIDVRRTRG